MPEAEIHLVPLVACGIKVGCGKMAGEARVSSHPTGDPDLGGVLQGGLCGAVEACSPAVHPHHTWSLLCESLVFFLRILLNTKGHRKNRPLLQPALAVASWSNKRSKIDVCFMMDSAAEAA